MAVLWGGHAHCTAGHQDRVADERCRTGLLNELLLLAGAVTAADAPSALSIREPPHLHLSVRRQRSCPPPTVRGRRGRAWRWPGARVLRCCTWIRCRCTPPALWIPQTPPQAPRWAGQVAGGGESGWAGPSRGASLALGAGRRVCGFLCWHAEWQGWPTHHSALPILHPLPPKQPTRHLQFLAPEKLRGVGGILLNSSGRRFVDELTTRDKAAQVSCPCLPACLTEAGVAG